MLPSRIRIFQVRVHVGVGLSVCLSVSVYVCVATLFPRVFSSRTAFDDNIGNNSRGREHGSLDSR